MNEVITNKLRYIEILFVVEILDFSSLTKIIKMYFQIILFI